MRGHNLFANAELRVQQTNLHLVSNAFRQKTIFRAIDTHTHTTT